MSPSIRENYTALRAFFIVVFLLVSGCSGSRIVSSTQNTVTVTVDNTAFLQADMIGNSYSTAQQYCSRSGRGAIPIGEQRNNFGSVMTITFECR